MGIVLLAIRVLLAITFAIAGMAKLLDPPRSRKSLRGFGIPASLARPLAFLLPVAELVCAIALIPDAWAPWGAGGVTVLLILFIAGISINLARGRTPDCNCFGQLSSEPIGANTLVRNFLLLAAACLVLWKGGGYPDSIGIASYSNFEIVLVTSIVLLATAVSLALLLLFQMLQQNGRLLVRLETIEKKLSIDPDAPPTRGLPAGVRAPNYGSAEAFEGTTVLVFTEPDCGPCEALQPELAKWREAYADRFAIIPVSDSATSQAYQVTGTPAAVLIVDGLVASSLAEGTAAIRDLVLRATSPPTVRKGDSVPALRLLNLEGETVDLTSLRGLRTLVLFWSPSCGYCQDMLEDVKKWERNRPAGAPELLIISSGSAEEIRDQGFSSTVLLDQDHIGSILGAEGTPSAVIINEHGIVASEVKFGADQVFDLALGKI